ncbi:hypothetical protein B296_00011125 [Ensete ventricosum]|uniref:DEK-C domain-containing protein n=1 Tax=Ensete ventricosum TaxID=4639 RepID=A0A427AHB8_ENSVE|nr:hypothetical protein B296_00011125 [Ensete ventricosum]
MYLTATSSLVCLSLISLAIPKFPEPMSLTSSYRSLSCIIGISMPGPTLDSIPTSSRLSNRFRCRHSQGFGIRRWQSRARSGARARITSFTFAVNVDTKKTERGRGGGKPPYHASDRGGSKDHRYFFDQTVKAYDGFSSSIAKRSEGGGWPEGVRSEGRLMSDAELAERLRGFLWASDLSTTTTTTTAVRRRLQDDFGVDISDKKAFIRQQVDLFRSRPHGQQGGRGDPGAAGGPGRFQRGRGGRRRRIWRQ